MNVTPRRPADAIAHMALKRAEIKRRTLGDTHVISAVNRRIDEASEFPVTFREDDLERSLPKTIERHSVITPPGFDIESIVLKHFSPLYDVKIGTVVHKSSSLGVGLRDVIHKTITLTLKSEVPADVAAPALKRQKT